MKASMISGIAPFTCAVKVPTVPSGRVMVNRLGIVGDERADMSVHGGLDKAVYLYPHEHYAFWVAARERGGTAAMREKPAALRSWLSRPSGTSPAQTCPTSAKTPTAADTLPTYTIYGPAGAMASGTGTVAAFT